MEDMRIVLPHFFLLAYCFCMSLSRSFRVVECTVFAFGGRILFNIVCFNPFCKHVAHRMVQEQLMQQEHLYDENVTKVVLKEFVFCVVSFYNF